jgi:outer membrane biosynthesis protein TonB
VLFQLYYAYSKLGNSAKAAEMKSLLNAAYAGSRYASIVNNGTDPESTLSTAEATKAYEGVYDLYIEGRFAEAQQAKARADSLYNTTFWSPQLLYIQSVYHIRQQEDSIAKGILNILIGQQAGTPMAEKAATLLDVLNRRAEIEAELTALQIERPAEEKVAIAPLPKPPVKEAEKEVAKVEEKKEEVAEEEEQQVAVTRTQQVQKGNTATNNKQAGINNNAPKRGVDTIVTKPVPQQPALNIYTYTPHTKYYAVVILNKVDVVYGNEAKNALTRYNREKYYNEPLQTALQQLDDDNKLLVIGDFVNVQAAIDYLQNAKAVAATQIMPWLKPEKYTFTLISEANLKLLQEKKDLTEYQRFLDQNLPVKF